MTLKEKLEVIKNYDDQDPHETFMAIADDYAIEFAEWVLNRSLGESGLKLKDDTLDKFKKEKGL
jgi:hypothetical protein